MTKSPFLEFKSNGKVKIYFQAIRSNQRNWPCDKRVVANTKIIRIAAGA